MVGRKPGIQYLIRIAVIVFVIAGGVSAEFINNLAYFITCLLVFVLSSQIRIVFLKGKLFMLSIFIELAIVYYIYTQFESVSYLLLFIPMVDSLFRLGAEGWLISSITAGLLIYILRDRNIETIILSLAIFIFLFFWCLQIKKLRNEIDNTETLYDENRKYSYQLEDAKGRLEEYSRRVEQLTQSDERNRISTELHDTIGHKLTGVFMQLEASIKVTSVDADGGMKMLSSVRDNLSNCIDLLRQTVRNMKPIEQSNRMLSIPQIISDFSRNTGVKVEFNISGIPFKLYPSAEITLFKNAQEALTNAVRHGKAKNIIVELTYSEEAVTLNVHDDGSGCTCFVKGMGLSGMEERAALLGGCITILSEDGFGVKTVIPVKMS